MAGSKNASGARWWAMAAAVAVAVGAVWVTLVDNGVTTSDPPPYTTGSEAEQEAWFAWVTTVLPQSRVARAVLASGLIGVGLMALRAAPAAWGSRGGAVAVASAAGLWCVADLAEAGGQQAVALMAASGNPIEAVAVAAFTIEMTTSWVEAGAAVLLGAGAAAMSREFLREGRTRRLGICSVLVGLAGVGFGVLIVVPEADTTIAGIALGVILLPVWVVWLSRSVTSCGASTRDGHGAASRPPMRGPVGQAGSQQ